MKNTRNTLGDLNDHLFMQIERLNDESIKGDELKEEKERAKAISGIAKNIIENGNLVLEVHRFADERWDADEEPPRMLEG